MKMRESGMPDETMWEHFFDAPAALKRLGLRADDACVVELGSGYGTFTLPAARMVRGQVLAFDIESDLVALVQRKARAAGLANILCEQRDFVMTGTGVADGAADYVMLFNILHAEQPEVLLREARRILRQGGRLAIMHWNYDASTPRGPSMTIRPQPEQCRMWAEAEGFRLPKPGIINLPPYHYGMVLECP
ncbi:MAG: class I SAM-dependent methyltransferase [Verrucomicrobia bacterium]|nr:MAG: class I SAM-dependent methyltransferase [Verrucomicrobiota bacterium]